MKRDWIQEQDARERAEKRARKIAESKMTPEMVRDVLKTPPDGALGSKGERIPADKQNNI